MVRCVNGFFGFSTGVDGFLGARLCSVPSTMKPRIGEENTALHMGIELEQRIERLSSAVARLEEAAAAASPAGDARNAEQLVDELAALKEENKVLKSAHEAVMGRLDVTIARLREVLGG